MKPFVVVGIPAFNEEQTIARVVLEAQKLQAKLLFAMMVLPIILQKSQKA